MAVRRITARETVRIEGLSEFIRDLRAVEKDLPKAVRQANFDLAQQVVGIAQAKASTKMERSAAETLVALASQREAAIRLGSNAKPYSLGAEFGAIQYKQFRSWTGNQWTGWNQGNSGYFLHPAIRESGEGPVFALYFKQLDDILARAFSMNGGTGETSRGTVLTSPTSLGNYRTD